MARAAALVLLTAMVVLVERAAVPNAVAEFRAVGLALGFTLVAATMLGAVAERLRLPSVTGYLAFGLVCGPYLLNLLTPPMARQLRLVNGLAITLIAFVAGLELDLAAMRRRLVPLLTFGGTTVLVMSVGLLAVLLIAWPWLPLAPRAVGLERLAIACVATALVASFSPTVTIAVVAESRARGPLSELVLAVVVFADLLLIVFFTLAMQFARHETGGATAEAVSLLVRLLWDVVGSLAFGALVGALFALYLRIVGREMTIVLLALCVLVSGLAAFLHLEPLLAALAAGVVTEGIAPPGGHALRDAVERGALPVLVVFFVAAGANLHLDALAEIGVLAVLVAAVRFGLIRLGTAAGRRLTGLPRDMTAWASMGLVAQAGVTLGLAALVASEFPLWGRPLQTLVIALSALHIVIGPMLFRRALGQAGEIGALDAEPTFDAAPSLRAAEQER